jgi:DNA excision repair protein ERCC-5
MTANRQSTLSGYFDASGGFGSGTLAPRKRQPYTSKRLQQVVSDYRKKKDDNGFTTPANNDAAGGQAGNESEGLDSARKGKGRSTGKKRPNVRAAANSKPRKRQKVVASESESETGVERVVEEETTSPSNVPDRPLGVTLRTRKAARKVVEDEDSDEFE